MAAALVGGFFVGDHSVRGVVRLPQGDSLSSYGLAVESSENLTRNARQTITLYRSGSGDDLETSLRYYPATGVQIGSHFTANVGVEARQWFRHACEPPTSNPRGSTGASAGSGAAGATTSRPSLRLGNPVQGSTASGLTFMEAAYVKTCSVGDLDTVGVISLVQAPGSTVDGEAVMIDVDRSGTSSSQADIDGMAKRAADVASRLRRISPSQSWLTHWLQSER